MIQGNDLVRNFTRILDEHTSNISTGSFTVYRLYYNGSNTGDFPLWKQTPLKYLPRIIMGKQATVDQLIEKVTHYQIIMSLF